MVLTSLTRFQAFFIHLAFSAIIFIVIALMIRLVWYPDFLFDLANGKQAILMIGGIDLILGPVLTLVVFDIAKKNLKIDMLIILIIQMCALGGGIYSIYVDRPIAVVYDRVGYVPVFALSPNSEVLRSKAIEYNEYLLYAPFQNVFSEMDSAAIYPFSGKEMREYLKNHDLSGVDVDANGKAKNIEVLVGGSGKYLVIDLNMAKVLGVK